jgi:hypothetical protein
MKNKKQKGSHNGDYRCERCWSGDKINLFPKSQFLGEDVKGFVILCEKCKDEAPSKSDEKEFNNLFLRFSSPKEFIQYYNAKNEKDAMKFWESEMKGEEALPDDPIIIPEKESQSIGVEDQIIPLGYEMKDEGFSVIQNEKEIIKGIFHSYLSGKTMEKITRELANEKEGEVWSLKEIREILKDPTYAGYKFQGGEVVKAQHEPIIKPETFNKVQQKIQRNIRNPKYRNNPLVLGD